MQRLGGLHACSAGSGWWVEPEYRKRGILTKLLDETERLLKAAGVRVWEEAVYNGNLITEHVLACREFSKAMTIYQKIL